MANITISDLSPTGAELLSDGEMVNENYMRNLDPEELSDITGGRLGPLGLAKKLAEVVYMKQHFGLDYDWRSGKYYYNSKYIA